MQSFTIEEFKKIHQTWKESGFSVRDYCANTGIKESRYMIDYNPIENCVRPLAIGRKNYMFCGNHDAAEEAAIMYTMMDKSTPRPSSLLTDIGLPNHFLS